MISNVIAILMREEHTKHSLENNCVPKSERRLIGLSVTWKKKKKSDGAHYTQPRKIWS